MHLETFETTWREEIKKDKGYKLGIRCKQGAPMAFYERALVMGPNLPVN
jgi:hypothetical protein